jgi:tRNA nucleotidyltransferase (CCA-adding enzyme)
MQQLTAKAMLPSVIYRLLDPFSSEARFVLSVLTDSDLVRQRLDLYEHELSEVSTCIDGYYLRSLDVPPGPIYGEILDRVQDALLDGRIDTVEEEQELAKSLVRALHNGEESR